MVEDGPSANRRSVLKATGAALGVGLGATPAAAAECSKIRLKNDYYLVSGSDYLQECVDETTGILVERGTEFDVYETCVPPGSSVTYYRVYCDKDLWVSDIHAECIEELSPPPCLS